MQYLSKDYSAENILTTNQKVFVVIAALWLIAAINQYGFSLLSYFISLTLLCYIFNSLFKIIVAITTKLNHKPSMPLALASSNHPRISLLVPLFKEAKVINSLINNLSNLNYTNFEVLLILEEDDSETFKALPPSLPALFKVILVPYSLPRTKPKALNYALKETTGEIIGIFDAEDIPDKDQLLKVAQIFTNRPEIVYVQGKLRFYNKTDNLLSRFFDIEYANIFEIFLPLACKSGYPFPLGGTTNFVRKKHLLKHGAWDIYNVTEDADLGLRFALREEQLAYLDSTTYEECPTRINLWLFQRARWIKGYLQTILVLLRTPLKNGFRLGALRSLFVALTLLFSSVFYILTPYIYLLSTYLYFNNYLSPILKIIAFVSLVLGLTSLWLQAITFEKSYRALLYPLYFFLHILAAQIAVYKLIKEPFTWDKTPHGLCKASYPKEIAN